MKIGPVDPAIIKNKKKKKLTQAKHIAHRVKFAEQTKLRRNETRSGTIWYADKMSCPTRKMSRLAQMSQ